MTVTASGRFPDRKTVDRSARDWWHGLQPVRTDASVAARPGDSRGNPAALARLRRASFVSEAMAEEATLGLYQRLGLASEDTRFLPCVAVIAMVLSHVREDRSHKGERRLSAIQSVGRTSLDEEDSAAMSSLRFRRLLACRDDDFDDLAREMRRLVQLAGGAVNVGDLAASLFFWNEDTRRHWAFDYFGAGFAAPRPDTTVSDAIEASA